VHLAEGNLAEAVRAHDVFQTLVGAELGVVPTEQMARLVRDVRSLRRRTAEPIG
jgi:hypothetical protein